MTVLLQDLQAALAPIAVGGAWYAVNEAQPPVQPFIVYDRVISTTNNNLAGPSNLQNTRVQVDVFAKTIAQAESIGRQVVAAMQAGPWNSVINLTSRDFYEAEIRAHRVSLDFSVWATN